MMNNKITKALFIFASTAVASVAIAQSSWSYDDLVPAYEIANGTHVVCYAEDFPSGRIYRGVGTRPSMAQNQAHRQCRNDDQSFRCEALGCRVVK